jgi:hypothetical protein
VSGQLCPPAARGCYPPVDALLRLTPLVVRVRVALLAPLSLSTWRAVACCRPGSAPVVSVFGPSAAAGRSRLIAHATATLLACVLAWFLCAFLQPCRPNPAVEVTHPFPSLLCRHEHWTCTLYSAGRGHLGPALRAHCFTGLCLYQPSPPRLASAPSSSNLELLDTGPFRLSSAGIRDFPPSHAPRV